MKKLTPQEIMILLKRVGDGKMTPTLANQNEVQYRGEWWGEIPFDVHGWKVIWFYKSGTANYLDEVVAPDGRAWQYGESEYPDGELLLADPTCYERMEQAFLDAPLKGEV